MPIDKYPIPTTCPHCGGKVTWGSNARIYGKEYGNGRCYLCAGCGASVGTHTKHPKEPLGMLSTEAMKAWKRNCHSLFDPIWKSGKASRGVLYGRLAEQLGIEKCECHFGFFDEEQLKRAWRVMREADWWKEKVTSESSRKV